MPRRSPPATIRPFRGEASQVGLDGVPSAHRPDPVAEQGGSFYAKGVSLPVAVSVFPGEQYQAPRSWAERAYPSLVYFHEADTGGHFAAREQPRLLAEEIRAAVRSLR